ncbi:MAG TPA: alanine racemase, partial [Actinomycetota bacterium]|nr:alanine racemase [Actinomycetota bacterium]
MTHPNDESAAARRARFDRATSHLEPPFALVDLESFRTNETDLVRRAGGKPIRLASKSVRCRTLQSRALENPGFKGTLAFTLPEALWLADNGFDDLVVAYPTVDRSALATLAERHADRITLMVDSSAHLDLIADAATDPARPIRVAIDVDAGLRLAGGRIRIGAKRSPVHTPEEAADLALDIVRRAGIELVGLMAYEAQVAGVGDRPKSRLEGAAIRALQSCSMRELKTRRAAIVAAVREVAPLEFVNGGGSGSVE